MQNNHRQLKFRVWDKNYNIFHIFDEIFLAVNWLGFVSKTAKYNNPEERLTDYVIQQFTGLTDKNGKEIYEGDIIKSPIKMFGIEEQLPLVVKFDKGSFEAFFPESKDVPAFPMTLNSALFNCEIIGNIFETPKLLKN